MLDHFARLGLPRRFAIDEGELERQYLARSREVHPDFHAAGATADLAASLDLSAALNGAYTTLSDDFSRAEYLLGLEGGPTAAELKTMPPDFLAEMLDLREQVEEAKAQTAACDLAVHNLRDDFASRLKAISKDVATRFAALEQTAANRHDELVQIRAALNAAKYLRGLLRDLNAD